MSRTPVREAIRELAASGLVEVRAHRGPNEASSTPCSRTRATRYRVQPFRRAQFRNLGRLAKSHVEHDRVVLAILRSDREGAAGAMREHLMLVCEEYEADADLGLKRTTSAIYDLY